MVCGTTAIDLAIQICPVIYTGYNESLLILNRIQDIVDCQGTLDTSVAPPVVRFSFPIREGNACGSTFRVSIASVQRPDSEKKQDQQALGQMLKSKRESGSKVLVLVRKRVFLSHLYELNQYLLTLQ